jgi:hypothetical protein
MAREIPFCRWAGDRHRILPDRGMVLARRPVEDGACSSRRRRRAFCCGLIAAPLEPSGSSRPNLIPARSKLIRPQHVGKGEGYPTSLSAMSFNRAATNARPLCNTQTITLRPGRPADHHRPRAGIRIGLKHLGITGMTTRGDDMRRNSDGMPANNRAIQ